MKGYIVTNVTINDPDIRVRQSSIFIVQMCDMIQKCVKYSESVNSY